MSARKQRHKLPAHGVAGANADKLRSGWVCFRGTLAALHEAPIRPREMRTRNTIEAGLLAVGEEPAHLQAHASRVAIDAVRLAGDTSAQESAAGRQMHKQMWREPYVLRLPESRCQPNRLRGVSGGSGGETDSCV